jgi:hypothetical protein
MGSAACQTQESALPEDTDSGKSPITKEFTNQDYRNFMP